MSTQVAAATSQTESAWEAIHGAYDLQVHVAPDVIERRIDDVGLAEEFLAPAPSPVRPVTEEFELQSIVGPNHSLVLRLPLAV